MSTRPQRPKLAYCLDKEANFWKNGFGERPILEGRMPLSDSVPCSGGAAVCFWEGREALGRCLALVQRPTHTREMYSPLCSAISAHGVHPSASVRITGVNCDCDYPLVLRWRHGEWSGSSPARALVPLSSRLGH
ncbi:unnamed protein product [Rangifer tarandus platyrhynchus]|uniref:Uncharacterized protein n=2 Tax=Rangifer tarandus platyrhynchus TaxID=3082113 RepID=A0AC59ZCY1_RANTA|nr:unnamed protein product [Rangifer tarandus platyrhynchus]